jgi:DNA-binding XRE family transcriptional regulator
MISVGLREWRLWSGQQQQALAAEAGVPLRTWKRWEHQGRVPELRLAGVAAVLGVPVERLRGPEPDAVEESLAEPLREHGAAAVVECASGFL